MSRRRTFVEGFVVLATLVCILVTNCSRDKTPETIESAAHTGESVHEPVLSCFAGQVVDTPEGKRVVSKTRVPTHELSVSELETTTVESEIFDELWCESRCAVGRRGEKLFFLTEKAEPVTVALDGIRRVGFWGIIAENGEIETQVLCVSEREKDGSSGVIEYYFFPH